MADRAGKGQAFSACEPDRVTAEALERRNNGLHLQHIELLTKSTSSLRPIRVSEELQLAFPLTSRHTLYILLMSKFIDVIMMVS